MQAPNTVDCHSVTHLLPNILRQALRQFSASSHSCRRHAFTARHATCPATAYHAFPFFLAPRHRAYLSRPHSIRLPPHPCDEYTHLWRVTTVCTAMSNSLEAKIVVLGSQGVGKTSLVHRYVKNAFTPPTTQSTVGASFLTKRVVDIDTSTVVRLQIWDTAGQERFRSISKLYYRGTPIISLLRIRLCSPLC